MTVIYNAELASLIDKFSATDGIHDTAITGMRCIKLSATEARLPTVYTPSVCFIAQGKKQVMLHDEIYEYAAPHYLGVSVHLPTIGVVTEASADKPYLCLQVELDQNELTELSLQSPVKNNTFNGRGLFIGSGDAALHDCTLRLARLMETPQDIALLAPIVKRELHYRLLNGAHGAQIAQFAQSGSHMQRIAQAIKQLKNAYDKPIKIEDMADWAGMSVSSFHEHFKNVTAMSPLQYQKRLRLMEARRVMIAERHDAATAAYHVGYESASQFSREYARLFGNPPKRDIDTLRAAVGA